MPNLYSGLEVVKRAAGITGSDRDVILLGHIEAASREADNLTNRRFIPITAVRRYSWAQPDSRTAYELFLDDDLLTVTTLSKEGDDAVAIASTDYFLEPGNFGPPYSWVEIDLASTAFFAAKDTHQRQIRITGSWGYSSATVAAGTLAVAQTDATGTVCTLSDSSLVDVGETILIGTEQQYVSAKALLDTTANTAGALVADASETTVPVNTGTLVLAGEIISVNSEKMLVVSISGNNLTVQRAYDGSVLAAHNNTQDVYAPRTATVTRGENGTTAASHLINVAISKYAPPADIVKYVRAQAISDYEAEKGGWTGTVGGTEASINITQRSLNALRDRVQHRYQRRLVGSV